jgi:hypothetical protein
MLRDNPTHTINFGSIYFDLLCAVLFSHVACGNSFRLQHSSDAPLYLHPAVTAVATTKLHLQDMTLSPAPHVSTHLVQSFLQREYPTSQDQWGRNSQLESHPPLVSRRSIR